MSGHISICTRDRNATGIAQCGVLPIAHDGQVAWVSDVDHRHGVMTL